MSDSIIEQVKRLAEAQNNIKAAGLGKGLNKAVIGFDDACDNTDFPALLAHMQAQQAVVDAARSVLVALGVDDVPYTGIKRALENLENLDTKAGG